MSVSEQEWRSNKTLGRPENCQNHEFSNFSYTRRQKVTKFENVGAAKEVLDHFD